MRSSPPTIRAAKIPKPSSRDIEKGFQGRNYEVIVDRREAIERAIGLAQRATSC